MRKIHINGTKWEYEIGKRVVVIHKPDGNKVIVQYPQFFGEGRWDRFQEEQNDYDYDGHWRMPVRPSDVKKYIEENLM